MSVPAPEWRQNFSHGNAERPSLSLPANQHQCRRTEIRQRHHKPVWFVVEKDKLYLLPVYGSDTQWYKNVLKNPQIQIDARGSKAELKAKPLTKSDAAKSVVEKFREKYGAADVKKYYSKFDVAVEAALA